MNHPLQALKEPLKLEQSQRNPMISNSSPGWNADWASPPGHLIEELRQERNISLHDFAGETGLTMSEVLDLERGEFAIDGLLAERLEYVFGAPEAFWLRLESQYRDDLAKGRKVIP